VILIPSDHVLLKSSSSRLFVTLSLKYFHKIVLILSDARNRHVSMIIIEPIIVLVRSQTVVHLGLVNRFTK
jgi:hypothetical protein